MPRRKGDARNEKEIAGIRFLHPSFELDKTSSMQGDSAIGVIRYLCWSGAISGLPKVSLSYADFQNP